MVKMRLVFLLLCLMIVGCSEDAFKERIMTHYGAEEFTITKFDSSKYSYVTLLRKKDGKVFERVRVDRRLTGHEKVKWVGRDIILLRVEYQQGKTQIVEFPKIADSFKDIINSVDIKK